MVGIQLTPFGISSFSGATLVSGRIQGGYPYAPCMEYLPTFGLNLW